MLSQYTNAKMNSICALEYSKIEETFTSDNELEKVFVEFGDVFKDLITDLRQLKASMSGTMISETNTLICDPSKSFFISELITEKDGDKNILKRIGRDMNPCKGLLMTKDYAEEIAKNIVNGEQQPYITMLDLEAREYAVERNVGVFEDMFVVLVKKYDLDFASMQGDYFGHAVNNDVILGE